MPPLRSTSPAPAPTPRFSRTAAAPVSLAIPRDNRRVLQRRRRSVAEARRSRRAALLLSLIVSVIGGGALLVRHGIMADMTARAAPYAGELAQSLGLGLDQVAVTGHRFTPERDIYEALDLARSRYLAGFDVAAARGRIEALPWIETAEVTRVYPSQLDVRVVERNAFAVWRHEGREVLIDRTGRFLQTIPAGSITHLPVVAGEAADKETAALMLVLARFAPLAEGMRIAERVNGRRWRLELRNGTRIDLPADGESLALTELSQSVDLAALADGRAEIVDVRAPARIAMRPAPAGAAAAASPGPVAGIGALIESLERSGGTP